MSLQFVSSLLILLVFSLSSAQAESEDRDTLHQIRQRPPKIPRLTQGSEYGDTLQRTRPRPPRSQPPPAIPRQTQELEDEDTLQQTRPLPPRSQPPPGIPGLTQEQIHRRSILQRYLEEQGLQVDDELVRKWLLVIEFSFPVNRIEAEMIAYILTALHLIRGDQVDWKALANFKENLFSLDPSIFPDIIEDTKTCLNAARGQPTMFRWDGQVLTIKLPEVPYTVKLLSEDGKVIYQQETIRNFVIFENVTRKTSHRVILSSWDKDVHFFIQADGQKWWDEEPLQFDVNHQVIWKWLSSSSLLIHWHCKESYSDDMNVTIHETGTHRYSTYQVSKNPIEITNLDPSKTYDVSVVLAKGSYIPSAITSESGDEEEITIIGPNIIAYKLQGCLLKEAWKKERGKAERRQELINLITKREAESKKLCEEEWPVDAFRGYEYKEKQRSGFKSCLQKRNGFVTYNGRSDMDLESLRNDIIPFSSQAVSYVGEGIRRRRVPAGPAGGMVGSTNLQAPRTSRPTEDSEKLSREMILRQYIADQQLEVKNISRVIEYSFPLNALEAETFGYLLGNYTLIRDDQVDWNALANFRENLFSLDPSIFPDIIEDTKTCFNAREPKIPTKDEPIVLTWIHSLRRLTVRLPTVPYTVTLHMKQRYIEQITTTEKKISLRNLAMHRVSYQVTLSCRDGDIHFTILPVSGRTKLLTRLEIGEEQVSWRWSSEEYGTVLIYWDCEPPYSDDMRVKIKGAGISGSARDIIDKNPIEINDLITYKDRRSVEFEVEFGKGYHTHFKLPSEVFSEPEWDYEFTLSGTAFAALNLQRCLLKQALVQGQGKAEQRGALKRLIKKREANSKHMCKDEWPDYKTNAEIRSNFLHCWRRRNGFETFYEKEDEDLVSLRNDIVH